MDADAAKKQKKAERDKRRAEAFHARKREREEAAQPAEAAAPASPPSVSAADADAAATSTKKRRKAERDQRRAAEFHAKRTETAVAGTAEVVPEGDSAGEIASIEAEIQVAVAAAEYATAARLKERLRLSIRQHAFPKVHFRIAPVFPAHQKLHQLIPLARSALVTGGNRIDCLTHLLRQ